MAHLGELLWEPGATYRDCAQVTKLMTWLSDHHGLRFDDYHALWRWSASDVEGFWQAMWDYFSLVSPTPYARVRSDARMPGTRWFEGARVSYARRMLAGGRDDDVAIYHYSEARDPGHLTWSELRTAVNRVAAALRDEGVEPGDRVAAYLPNTPEAAIAMLATTGIGAVWSSCSPDFGTDSVLDRFRQIAPKVLIAVDGYRYGGKPFDRRDAVRTLVAALPSLERVIFVPYLFPDARDLPCPGARRWQEIARESQAPEADALLPDLSFDHPLWIVYSSGTTGLPKAMVHGHGGILLEQLKLQSFHMDLGPSSRTFFYTTTGWVMFNLLLSGLLTGASVVLYDGSPAYPDMHALWRIAAETRVTNFGTSPTFVNVLNRNGVYPKASFDVDPIRAVLCTGSPLTPESFSWIYDNVKSDLWVSSISGGTDVATGFVGGVPILPVHSGEMQGGCLGVDVQAFDPKGRGVVDEEGELVVTQPMPSMPLYFWNDPDGTRYHESYFDTYPGVWRHGDLLRETVRGSYVISGRSDSTLNRFGVRIGTSEIYRTVEEMDEVLDSLVVHLDPEDGDSMMVLFVTLAGEATLDDALRERIGQHLRTERSPRHVPDRIVQISDVPYTLTGKKMEVPVKRILLGAMPEQVANRDATSNPESIDQFAALAGSFT